MCSSDLQCFRGQGRGERGDDIGRLCLGPDLQDLVELRLHAFRIAAAGERQQRVDGSAVGTVGPEAKLGVHARIFTPDRASPQDGRLALRLRKRDFAAAFRSGEERRLASWPETV